jgi:hypothetical protein
MPLSATDKLLLEQIENDFTYHPPAGEQAQHYENLRSLGKTMALAIVAVCPDGKERTTALAKLEECVMWANAGIARADTK